MKKSIKPIGAARGPSRSQSRIEASRIAQETVTISSVGNYVSPSGATVDISQQVENAVQNTVLYTSSDIRSLVNRATSLGNSFETKFEVNNETTFAAAKRLVEQYGAERVAALNFASAKNVGGGFLSGAQAQEESLARASALYPCLLTQQEYYDANRINKSALYTDHMILSPQVSVFRDDDGNLLDEPWEVTIITSPAPHRGAIMEHEMESFDKIEGVFRRRIEQVLASAAVHGNTALVLGAWGCGVFRNDPELVAKLFMEQLKGQFAGTFEHVVFAILWKEGHPNGDLVQIFKDVVK